jgi:hypothetical protein
MSFLSFKCAKPSRYSLHRYLYFPTHDRYHRVTITSNEEQVTSNEITVLFPGLAGALPDRY